MDHRKPSEIEDTIVSCFENMNLIPIVGAGVSFGVRTVQGKVPSGGQYMDFMREAILKNTTLSDDNIREIRQCNDFPKLCSYYENDSLVSDDVRHDYLVKNFYKAKYDVHDYRRTLFEIDWPYIYSLNLDDAIENSSEYTVIKPNSPVREEIYNTEKCVIKLHGDIEEIVKYETGSKVFTSKEYALSLDTNSCLLGRLQNDFENQNIVFIGCSLDNEFDLQSITRIHNRYTGKKTKSRTFFFKVGEYDILKTSQYELYDITDIVYFDDYESMYDFLLTAWQKSKRLKPEEISDYSKWNILKLNSREIERNQGYFMFCTRLLDYKKKLITIPSFFTPRNIVGRILAEMEDHKIIIIRGNQLSGKSYVLTDIYCNIKDRNVYIFDSSFHLTDSAMNKLLAQKDSDIIFDTGSLDTRWFDRLLSEAKPKENGCNYIIGVRTNDSTAAGILRKKYSHELENNIISMFEVENTFHEMEPVDELDYIRGKMLTLKLLPFEDNKTIMDQIMMNEVLLSKRGILKEKDLAIDTVKEMAAYVILATKEMATSLSAKRFGVSDEMDAIARTLQPVIEKTEVLLLEKDNKDLSTVKYVLNSKYSLIRGLGRFANNPCNHAIIADAYHYIISRIMSFCGGDTRLERKHYLDFIFFDVINEIFCGNPEVKSHLIVRIYERLHELLLNDYNFLHQEAKSLLHYTRYCKEPDKKKILIEARNMTILAESLADTQYKKYANDSVLLTLEHILFTRAIILSDICINDGFSSIEENIEAVDGVYLAIMADSTIYEITNKGMQLHPSINRCISHMIANITKLPKEAVEKCNRIIAIVMSVGTI